MLFRSQLSKTQSQVDQRNLEMHRHGLPKLKVQHAVMTTDGTNDARGSAHETQGYALRPKSRDPCYDYATRQIIRNFPKH